MLTFIIAVAILIIGFIFYGKHVDNIFGPDDRETPAVTLNDGEIYGGVSSSVGVGFLNSPYF